MIVPFIDTNIFIRFLIPDNINPHLSQKARSIFKRLTQESLKVQTQPLVVAEIVHILERYYKISKLEVVARVQPLLSLPTIDIVDKEDIFLALSIYAEQSIDFEDAYTYVCMLKAGTLKIYTFDEKHFKRLEGVEILS